MAADLRARELVHEQHAGGAGLAGRLHVLGGLRVEPVALVDAVRVERAAGVEDRPGHGVEGGVRQRPADEVAHHQLAGRVGGSDVGVAREVDERRGRPVGCGRLAVRHGSRRPDDDLPAHRHPQGRRARLPAVEAVAQRVHLHAPDRTEPALEPVDVAHVVGAAGGAHAEVVEGAVQAAQLGGAGEGRRVRNGRARLRHGGGRERPDRASAARATRYRRRTSSSSSRRLHRDGDTVEAAGPSLSPRG